MELQIVSGCDRARGKTILQMKCCDFLAEDLSSHEPYSPLKTRTECYAKRTFENSTMEPRCNEPLYNEVLVITNDVKYMEKNLDITKPHYSEHILAVP